MQGHHNVYVSIHVPGSKGAKAHDPHRGGKHHRHHRGRQHLKPPGSSATCRPVTPPSQRVQFILGEDLDSNSHVPHPLFSELEELFKDGEGQMEWKETARWVKFEEDVEEGGNRSLILNNTVCLDMSATNLNDIAELVLDNMHRHQYESSKKNDGSASNMSKLPIIRSLAEIGRNHSSSKSMHRLKELFGSKEDLSNIDGENQTHETCFSDSKGFLAVPGTEGPTDQQQTQKDKTEEHEEAPSPPSAVVKIFLNDEEYYFLDDEKDVVEEFCTQIINPEGGGNDINRNLSGNILDNNDSTVNMYKMNSHFMKKIPKDAETSNILIGELNILEKPLSAFIRLNEATVLGDLTEVPVPTRFIFILLGPDGENKVNVTRYREIGRAMATVMSDEVFHNVAYKAKKREHLLAGIDEFLDAVTVLPPGEWDPSIRIEPPTVVPSQENRKHPNLPIEHRKKPFYLSDFKDCLALQCIASYIFIYFACLTPIITFGGLLGDATENRIAAIESLVSGLIVGVAYGFFSGQPLTILGSTGPILVFETILYDFCKGVGWEYLSFRLCIGCWIGAILLILVATDASAFVCYITRFTEENFACLIAFIFIKKALDKVFHIGDHYPIHESPCECIPGNKTELDLFGIQAFPNFTAIDKQIKPHQYPCNFTMEGLLVKGIQSVGCHYEPNAYLMSIILFLGTFTISSKLKAFKTANFFPTNIRGLISDFAVIIAIVTMSLMDFFVAVDTPKLSVPETLVPTWSGRTWLISPLGTNPWWSVIAAFVPAVLATILIFMDQQITAVIVNRKEHKLNKGCGYHLDLFIVLILIVICSIFGLPWFVAATVLSINHVKSLTRESECAAPGEKPQFLGIREQRVTHILIFLSIGLSVFMTPMLSLIPMPVLYGVFLYMGAASLNGLQFFDRMLLIFMPKKYQPDLPYLRKVPINRVHFFTLIQFLCLVGLWIIKDIKATSILFPLMLVVMMGVRKLLDFIFSKADLKALDDILPEFKRKEKLDDEEALGKSDDEDDSPDIKNNRRASLRYTKSSIEVPMANGNVIKIPLDSGINISEEMNRSGVWRSLEGNNGENSHIYDEEKEKQSSHKKRMSVVNEEDDGGIQIKASSRRKNTLVISTLNDINSKKGSSEEKQCLVKKANNSETVV
ncbi:Electrogenic sodium bicarbonate cotransporter 1,Anion exchange protein 4,Sodium-driven chloride bicarbonate exchanger,Electroneutral sodium bicarbonate exchanger 1,Sodium bicarbonate cotransporter 3,Electrogenic sodium bicarbonate cotransporter 4,Anion exchange protein 3 [Lepeophtheirus salmonis]|uniref:Anion exchange protein n=1 Tax=Lepeophtheirus salmonis TaxID=72036 RepID=A0A7R8CUG9_LEPSM|nr:Electrogenic sodium bicarbonate cotransporter 1,Anion exchange protein 4,Sodium-driven chloride bicarbonate exchanger,Electroneutral sodium bicarbonate exchanger 1,Sodium bicarbonate cotransporter 3,Electrogenic sodium bicarbonate cotransporter 4,Anion exchange protein 3 [Lepeophtheirus salmonis]CAF2936517.1 Electrogenic sodium bicarbonate cotransporter 1,Anion exchange protein 4,Sodium-driven chloride bicarbonate exchanger,Electroneutral sodium bicarbonate exchanger 1,Sodium bicarbonate cotran